MDFYTNSTSKVQKGRGLGSRDRISKLCDRCILGQRSSAQAVAVIEMCLMHTSMPLRNAIQPLRHHLEEGRRSLSATVIEISLSYCMGNDTLNVVAFSGSQKNSFGPKVILNIVISANLNTFIANQGC